MPRGSNTQTRTFNYLSGTTVGIDLLSATNPENGTVTYTYNSDHTLHTKTDAKNQQFTYAYDSYKRLTTISVGGATLRTFIYDTNTLDNTGFSGSYTQGRLVAVQNAQFAPQGYVPGNGGSNVSVPSPVQFTEMYAYTQPGLTSKKRLQTTETFHYFINNNPQQSTQTLNLDGAYTYDTEGKITSVNYPTTYSWNGSQLVANTGPTYSYSFDAMSRPTGLTDQSNNTAVSNVQYNPANQLLAISYFGTNETRQYNNMNQMTNLTVGSDAITYTFPAGTNNGKISSQTDSVSGETVTYQYDSLNRLLSATGSTGWSETYGFDEFGNLVSKAPTGGAPTLSQAVDAATNRIVGQSYDGNGNQTSSSLGTLAYDAENRMAGFANGGVQYAYDSRNKRIWKATLVNGNMTQEVYFYGVDGQKLGTYPLGLASNGPGVEMTDNNAPVLAVFFGGKRVGIVANGSTTPFKQNRLGSNQGFQFYPYGEARGTAPADTVGFATYTRDSATGLDYADQRYYANNFGRFMTADRYTAGGAIRDPRGWDRYSYAGGDPINSFDPSGKSFHCDDSKAESIYDASCNGDPADAGASGDGTIGGGNDGGGDPCAPSGDAFSPDPSPDPPPCPAPPAPPPPAPPPPECTIDVRYRPVYVNVGGVQLDTGKFHLMVITIVNGVRQVFEGEPNPEAAIPDPPSCNPAKSACPTDSMLVGVTTPGGTKGLGTEWNSVTGGSDICFDALAIAAANSRYNTHQLHYTDNGAPNSNSYAYTLLFYSGLASDFGLPPVDTPGWGYNIIANPKNYR